MKVGVLALQGAFALHAAALVRVGAEPVLVRSPRDLDGVGGLVLPGGESSVQLDLVACFGLRAALDALFGAGVPILATCAGAILVAREVVSPAQSSFGWIDVDVVRNGWGRQIDSAVAESDLGRELVFIRAPRIVRVGDGVEVLDRYRGEPVLVRQANVVAATFHPELGHHDDLHRALFATPGARSTPDPSDPSVLGGTYLVCPA